MRSSNSRRRSQRTFPEWIPRCIQDLVQILYNDADRHNCAKDVEVLDRLTLDLRMKKVWDELLKKKRSNYGKTEQYVYPAASYHGSKRLWSFAARSLQSRAEERRKRGEGLEADRVLTRALLLEMEVPNIFNRLHPAKFAAQEQGLIFLFYTAFKFAQETPQSVAVAEARKVAGRFRAMAKTIRADAAQNQRMRGYFDHRLRDAAFAYEELADDAVGSLGTVVLVRRKARSEPRL